MFTSEHHDTLEKAHTIFNAFLDQKSRPSNGKVGIFVGMNGVPFSESGYSCGFPVLVRYLT